MSATVVARRYAEALADIVTETGQTALVDEELGAFVRLLRTNQDLIGVFSSPVISQKDKLKVLQAIIDRTGPGQMTVNLLKLLLRNYRLHNLDLVYEQFRREINRRAGIVPAEVTTAAQLRQSEQEGLSRRLEKMTGMRVQLEFKTDPSLIGGAVTRVGSVVYDGSIRARLETIKQKLRTGEA